MHGSNVQSKSRLVPFVLNADESLQIVSIVVYLINILYDVN